jgi:hypothetical protein
MRTLFSRSFVIAAMLALVACGGSGEGSEFEDPGNGNTPPPGAGTNNAAVVTVVSNVQSIPSTGTGEAEITALVRDANNNLISDVPITFTASSGGIAVTQDTTNSSGRAEAALPAPRWVVEREPISRPAPSTWRTKLLPPAVARA